ncbi:MAG: type-F conjugative transfer system secretin TraK [Pseudomonadota bacterium]
MNNPSARCTLMSLVSAGSDRGRQAFRLARRECGASFIAATMLVLPQAAHADQNLLVADNGQVQCDASLKDLTRISLKNDQFASVSKVSTGNSSEDFSVVGEPVRGDIYLSVPEGFARASISFFGTTRRGYVYKFTCKVAGDEARQVFLTNADIEHPRELTDITATALSDDETAIRLMRAMAQQLPTHGFDVRWKPLVPVMAGTLRVQVLGQYYGVRLNGRILRLENRGSKAVTIAGEQVASTNAIAVSIGNPDLAPGQVTTAYIVEPHGEPGERP